MKTKEREAGKFLDRGLSHNLWNNDGEWAGFWEITYDAVGSELRAAVFSVIGSPAFGLGLLISRSLTFFRTSE